ncbi:hypothetical protein KRR38_02465 [Novosphingobium sp. G106]|uniref:hypothetical protein n=1 Tax=Novosphingobium sp. G106 TaxID=2849500 RepID=UPI001C2D4031|nr:hypothetical protein [Novosphingobium sp. G106]MBV1686560.1 hypothetical protein [Novosphingobium sp. G106]
MKNFLIGEFLGSLLLPAPRPVEKVRDSSIQSMMAETRRELAVFASDMMGAQSFVGQFDPAHREAARIDRSSFRNAIEDTSDPFMVIDPRPGLHIIDINDAYAAATMTARDKAAGDKLFDVFPDNPADLEADGVSNLYESIQKAAQSGRPHVMAIQRYDVRDADGSFVEKRWQPINTPVFDEDGRLIYILHQANPLSNRRR